MYCKTINSTVNPKQIVPGAVVLIEECPFRDENWTMEALLNEKPAVTTYRDKLLPYGHDMLIAEKGKWALCLNFCPSYIEGVGGFIGRSIRVISTP